MWAIIITAVSLGLIGLIAIVRNTSFFKNHPWRLGISLFILIFIGVGSSYLNNNDLHSKFESLRGERDKLADSLIALNNYVSKGKLEAQWSEPLPDNSGLVVQKGIFRSQGGQSLQDIYINIIFNGNYESAFIKQVTNTSSFNGNCQRGEGRLSNTIRYKCDFLNTGNWIEATVYSKGPLEIITSELRP